MDSGLGQTWPMPIAVLAAVFPVIFIAELPDKTMFASLILSTRGRPLSVWAGAALAFTVHVAIAVTVGATLFAILPRRAVDGVVAVMFVAGAIFAYRDSIAAEEAAGERAAEAAGVQRTVATAFAVIFLAEWGDLTQILTATLAAQYRDWLAVAVAAILALWSVAALAVTAGRLLERLPMPLVRRLTAVVLMMLALIAGAEAALGWAGPL